MAFLILTLNNGDSFLRGFEVLELTVDAKDIANNIKTVDILIISIFLLINDVSPSHNININCDILIFSWRYNN